MQQLPTIPQTPPTSPPLDAPISTPNDPMITTAGPEPETNAVVPEPPQPKGEGWKSVVSTVAILIAAPLIALILTVFVFQSYEVDGPSMQTTLDDHDRLIVLKAPKTWARITHHDYIPKRGDIIIFSKSGLADFGDAPGVKRQLIKRVIGVPGDHVVVKEGKITIYNKEHPEGFNPDANVAWTNAIITTPGDVDRVIQPGEVFACGDNRTNSFDSRSFGTVPSRDIVGKLLLRVFPLRNAEKF